MKRISILVLFTVLVLACKKEDPKPTPQTPGKYAFGVLISNEGPFSSGSGTLSWYDKTANAVENNVFQTANGLPIGSVFQSVYADATLNRAYLVVNNSQKIIVTNLGTMKQTGQINGFSSPRFMLKTELAKAYVTDWVSNTVAVVNLNNNSITDTIPVGNGPERMLAVGNRVIVANSGGFGSDSTISVINALTDEVAATYVVGYNPNSMVTDANGTLWVLCGGINDFANPANSTPGKLVQFDLGTGSIIKELEFPTNTDHPVQLCRNKAGTLVYWLSNSYAGSVYEMNISAPSLPTAAKINGSFYAMNIDPLSDEIYTTDALDFQQDGILRRFNNSGSLMDSVRVGLIPGGITFN